MPDDLSIDSKTLIFATLADVYLSSGMIDEAISILKDGLARNPNYTLAKIILGRAYYMKGETEQALKVLEAIYDEAQDSENENLFLAHCYKRQAEFDKARKHYEAVLKINADNKDARRELSTLSIATPSEIAPAGAVAVEPPVAPVEAPAVSIEIKGKEEPALVKEVELPEGDITPAKEIPEPEITIQEPPVKIHVPKSKPDTISKEEIEISLPTNEPAQTPVMDITSAVEEAMKVASVPEPPPAATPTPPPKTETVPVAEPPAIPVKEPPKAVTPEPAEPVVKEITPSEAAVEPPPLFEEEMAPAAEPAPVGTPFDRLDEPMKKLLALKTVNAAFISASDGLLIKNYSESRTDAEEISALIAAVYYEAMESFKFLNVGAMEKCVIEKADETICMITAGESLLCVITEPEAKPGLVFVYARKIIDEIREVLG